MGKGVSRAGRQAEPQVGLKILPQLTNNQERMRRTQEAKTPALNHANIAYLRNW